MNKTLLFVLSAAFLLASGFLYTFERFIAYYSWVGQMGASAHTGSYPNYPLLPGLFTNWFVVVFICISVILFVMGIRKRDS